LKIHKIPDGEPFKIPCIGPTARSMAKKRKEGKDIQKTILLQNIINIFLLLNCVKMYKVMWDFILRHVFWDKVV